MAQHDWSVAFLGAHYLFLVFIAGQRRLTLYYFAHIDFKKDILPTVKYILRFKQNFYSDTMQMFTQMR